MEEKKNFNSLPLSIIIASVIIALAWVYVSRNNVSDNPLKQPKQIARAELKRSVAIPAVWGDIGKKLVSVKAIDPQKFEDLYAQRGGLSEEMHRLLYRESSDRMIMNHENVGYYLNLLWALGLAQESNVLEKGEIMDSKYGGADRFASTGGWTLAHGNPMEHYSRHRFFTMTPEQEALVDTISKGIYRPCCNNSTHFPDCNHGMAMLGLLELMASQGASESEMWDAALAVNALWYPQQYETIAAYMAGRGISWEDVSPKEVLGFNYSSASGYQNIESQVALPPQRQSGGCIV